MVMEKSEYYYIGRETVVLDLIDMKYYENVSL